MAGTAEKYRYMAPKGKKYICCFAEGMLRGIVHRANRTGSGALDLAIFWLPTVPSPDPLYIWDDFYEKSSYYAFRSGMISTILS